MIGEEYMDYYQTKNAKNEVDASYNLLTGAKGSIWTQDVAPSNMRIFTESLHTLEQENRHILAHMSIFLAGDLESKPALIIS